MFNNLIRSGARAALLLVALVLAAACARNRPVTVSEGEESKVQIENRGWVDMTIYVVEGGADRRRLGVAPATGTSIFTLPPEVVRGGRELQFQGDPVGARGSTVTRRVWVQPGETVIIRFVP